jgi:hypothetical protein
MKKPDLDPNQAVRQVQFLTGRPDTPISFQSRHCLGLQADVTIRIRRIS